MGDRFDHNNNLRNSRIQDFNTETKMLMHMESVHQRKKAAFDELLRYTYTNLKDSDEDNSNNKQL